MRQERGIHAQPGKKKIDVAPQQDNPAGGADQVGFDRHELLAAFFLRMPRGGDVFAEVARMASIEGLRDSFRQRDALRVLHNHAPPRDGLQDNPMRADRQA